MVYLTLFAGLVILLKGADVLINSATKAAEVLKIPAFIVGLFIVAMVTSAPEFAVGVLSGIQGTNLISFGDIVGSSIINIAIVIGFTSIFYQIKIDSKVPRRELPLLIFIQVVLIGMFFTGNTLARVEAGALVLGFLAFLGYIVKETRQLADKEPADTAFEKEVFEFIEAEKALVQPAAVSRGESKLKLLVLFLLGLLGLIGGAQLAVNSAVSIAHSLGLSEELIGITIVAFGTSLPELAAITVAAIKEQHDIAVGNIVGSNIFNVLWVLGISALINPITIAPAAFFDLFAQLAASVMLMVPALLFGVVSRMTGFIFLGAYILYLGIRLTYIA